MVVVVVVVEAIILHVVYVIMPTIASVFSDTCLSNLLSLVFMTHARGGGCHVSARALITPQSVATLLYCNLDAKLPH